MVNVLEKQIVLFEKTIFVRLTQTDEGITAFVTGGDKTHVGAVTVIDHDGKKDTITLPGHKETIIAETWADVIYAQRRVPVVVTAGIHFEHITKEQIEMVLKATDELLNDMLLSAGQL